MAKFEITARTLIHLGSELITSDEIALYELIKNAFDAFSPRVEVFFNIPIHNDIIKNILIDLSSASSVTDIDLVDIQKKLSSNMRNDLSADVKKETKFKISSLLNIKDINEGLSILNSINYIKVSDTGIGMTKNTLESVFLCVGTPFKLDYKNDNPLSHEDRVLLGNKGIGRLSMMRLGKYAKVNSWTKSDIKSHEVNFNWEECDSSSKNINEIDISINEANKPPNIKSGTTILIYGLTSDWNKERIDDNIIDRFLRRLKNPFSNKKISFPIDIYLNNNNRIPIKPPSQELWALADREFTLNFDPRNISDDASYILDTKINEVKNKTNDPLVDYISFQHFKSKLPIGLDELKKIGPFKLNIRWFNRRNLTKDGLGKNLKTMRKELDIWSGGIAIYRDHFRIGMTGSDKDGDWLGIDSSALKRGGFVVNKIQTVGALEISKNENKYLIDKTNREGLVENEQSEHLRSILVQFGLGTLREYITVENTIEAKTTLANFVETGTSEIEDKLLKSQNNISDIRSKVKSPEVKDILDSLSLNMHYIETEVKKYNDAISDLKESREDILELAGVGTVMHSVLHELIRSTSQTRNLIAELSENSEINDDLQDLLQKLEKEIKFIDIRMSQLDPLSPNKRQRKRKFNIVKLVRTILDGYSTRRNRHNVQISFLVDGEVARNQVVDVFMVEGFVSLALENLLTNSFYWLKQRLKIGEDQRKILIDIDSSTKTIIFSDNGPGIDIKYKERIFNPGFSMRNDGNGFGLYIAKEVAAYHDAQLYLDSVPEEDLKLRTFIFELPQDKGE